jgi:hypothetical protein
MSLWLLPGSWRYRYLSAGIKNCTWYFFKSDAIPAKVHEKYFLHKVFRIPFKGDYFMHLHEFRRIYFVGAISLSGCQRRSDWDTFSSIAPVDL